MARFIDPRRTVPFVLPADREKPEGDRTTFTLGILTASQWAGCTDLAGDKDLFEGGYGLGLLREGLRGWQGPAGTPPFATDAAGRPTVETLSTIHPADRLELVRELYRMNRLQDADAGK